LKQFDIDKARSMYQQTAGFFETVATLCLEKTKKIEAAICFKCMSASILRNFYLNHDKLRHVREDIIHQSDLAKNLDSASPEGGVTINNGKQVSFYKDMEDVIKCLDSIYKAELYGESLITIPDLIEHVRKKLQ
jgi:hypothetical protein